MLRRKLFKFIIACIAVFSLNSIAFATEKDVVPPSGEFVIENATLKDGVYYSTVKTLNLKITASDNVTSLANLKMLVTDGPATGEQLASISPWRTYSSKMNFEITGDIGSEKLIYLYLKDEAGNISPNVVTAKEEFTVMYSAEGATDVPDAQTVTCGIPFSIALKEPKMENKYFMGWSTINGATTASWLSEGVIEPKYISSNITLYAVWADEPRAISEVAEIGDWVAYPVEYENADSNSKLNGWRVIDITDNVVKLISAGTPLTYTNSSSNATIQALTTNFLQGTSSNYAAYGFEEDLSTIFGNVYTQKVESVKESDILKLTGGTTVSQQNVSSYGGPLNNETSYYISSGTTLYSLDESNGTISETGTGTYGVRPVVTLINDARVTGKNQDGEWKIDTPNIMVTLNSNGGAIDGNETTSIEFKYGEEYGVLATPTKTGYTFVGWYTAVEGGTEITSETIVSTIDTLYAVWTPNTDTKFTVYHYLENSSDDGYSLYQTIEHTGTTASTITLADYQITIEGGNYEKSAIKAGGSSVATTEIAANGSTKVYLYYTADTYTVTLDKNDAISFISGAGEYKVGESVTVRATLAVESYYTISFVGWESSDTSILPDQTAQYATFTMPASDVTLTAIGTKVGNQYTVTFNANGGTIVDTDGETSTTKDVRYGDEYGTLPVAERDKYDFVGWYTASTGGTQIVEDGKVVITKATTVYAQWKANNLMDLIPSVANAPVLSTSGDIMKAVYWTDDDGSGETEAEAFTEEMYSYVMGDGQTDSKESKWANAKTEDGSYWVWIPRFAYKITYTNSANTDYSTSRAYGNIDILFMYGTSNEYYRDINGNPVELPEDYVVHPAFQAMTTVADLETNPLGKWDEELEGIWVAKYEASRETSTDGTTWTASSVSSTSTGNTLTTNAGSTSTTKSRIVSKPSVNSWRYISENYIYQNSLSMYESLNSHEMKNSEWGAVAYLTESAYGRNGNEVAVNQCSSFYTGAGPGTGTSTVYNSTYAYSSSTFADTYAWNTEQGKKASTTGNIYGIYDMSGGAYEYVAAYVNNGNSNITNASYGGKLGTSTDLKTKQIYTSASSTGTSTQSTDYALAADTYGDAVYETSTSYSIGASWYSNYSNFPSSSNPFFLRGGYCGYGSSAGVFGFVSYRGVTYDFYGFRPVLCVSSGT